MRKLTDKARKFIASEKLMNIDGKYIVALSGGADSVSLLLCLKELGYKIEAAHCNFRLRGAESDRDETFCKNLCARTGIAIHIIHFDTKAYAALHKVSIEMAARTLRYNYFEQLRRDIKADGICIGHHMEDTVETFLLNAIRGTGIKGLTGISAKNGYILRPLLPASRNDIECYLEEQGEDFITDSSNLINDVKRNKIRLDVMPELRSVNESADRCIWETTRKMNEAYKVFEDALEKSCKSVSKLDNGNLYISIAKLKEQTSPEYTLYHILTKLSFSPSTIECIHEKIDLLRNSSIFTSATHRLIHDRGFLIVEPIHLEEFKSLKIPECGTYVISNGVKIKVSSKEYDKDASISKSPESITVDSAKITMPLCLRRCTKGDTFTPYGMKGKKLVSDFMTDKKFNLFQKERQLVLVDSMGKIIWVVGQRSDDRVKITSHTSTMLYISLFKDQAEQSSLVNG